MHVNPDRQIAIGMITFLLAACLLLAGCLSVPPAVTPVPLPTITPTEAPIPICTPPYCWEDEVLSCPSKCPGGCGTTCVTRTPDPNASPTPTFPPLSGVCALPTPNPTQTPGMDLCASSSEVHVGGAIQLAARLTGVFYSDIVGINGRDLDGTGGFYIRARTGDHLPTLNNLGSHLSLEWVQTHDDQIFVLLKAVSPGQVKIHFQVNPTVPDIRSSITLTVLP